MEIYVSNLPYSAEEADLLALFEPFGKVARVKIAREPNSTRSRGFGFVTMHEQPDGEAAISELNGAELQGRKLTVRKSEPRPPADLGGYVPPSQRPGFKGYGDKRR